ncbi:MAG: Peptidoglycan O-acetyltransferase [Desulfovibrio sp.]
MVFSSTFFIWYFLPVALLLYVLCSFSRLAQNVCLLIVSMVFYAWGEPLHIIPLIYLILVNYTLGLFMSEGRSVAGKRTVIKLAVVLNIGMLVFVRYAAEVLARLGEYTGVTLEFTMPPTPLGVSFFTLQALAYVLDLGRGKAKPEKNIINVGLYIAMFPTILAGPILRFGDMAKQLRDRAVTLELFGKGCARFVIGLAKMTLLASPLALVADNIFTLSAMGTQVMSVPVLLAWLGVFAFGLQIYFTLAAYSDMAIGMGAMFGFSIRENVLYPYTARTVADFWNRWNISLYRWFYVYVFIALGGPRPKRARVRGRIQPHNFIVRNLFVLWLLLALWHGVSWSFAIWGAWFFLFALFEWIVRLPQRNLTSPLWRVYLLLVVGVSWVFFRCHSIGECGVYLSNMLGINDNGFLSPLALTFARESWLVFLAGILLATPVGLRIKERMQGMKAGALQFPVAACYWLGLATLFGISLVFLARTPYIPYVL